jgi:hypothetical protein
MVSESKELTTKWVPSPYTSGLTPWSRVYLMARWPPSTRSSSRTDQVGWVNRQFGRDELHRATHRWRVPSWGWWQPRQGAVGRRLHPGPSRCPMALRRSWSCCLVLGPIAQTLEPVWPAVSQTLGPVGSSSRDYVVLMFLVSTALGSSWLVAGVGSRLVVVCIAQAGSAGDYVSQAAQYGDTSRVSAGIFPPSTHTSSYTSRWGYGHHENF